MRVFFAEEIKSARRLLKKLNPLISFEQCKFYDLNEHISFMETEENFRKIGDQDMGVISEAGCPCLADPGADVVLWHIGTVLRLFQWWCSRRSFWL